MLNHEGEIINIAGAWVALQPVTNHAAGGALAELLIHCLSGNASCVSGLRCRVMGLETLSKMVYSGKARAP